MPDDADHNLALAAAVPAPARRAPSVPSRGLRRWRSAREFFRRDRLREFAKTLALVVPLTVLIWVWAEREQTVGTKAIPEKRTFTLAVRGSNPAKTASLAPGQADTVVVELSGPKSGFDELDALTRDGAKRRLTVDINDGLEAGGPYPLPVDGLLNQQKIFGDAGLTVRSTEPASIQVMIDRQIERDLPVRLPAELSGAVQRPTFEPSTVRVRGPERTLTQLASSGQLVAEIDITNLSDYRNRGQSRVELTQVPLRSIGSAGVTFDVPSIARVTLELSQEEQGEIKSMVVYVNKPAALESDVTATVTPLVLTNVKVFGPSDVLAQLRDGNKLPVPYAKVTITREDIGTRGGTRMPTFVDLPPGVRVVADSVAPVTFDVIEARTE